MYEHLADLSTKFFDNTFEIDPTDLACLKRALHAFCFSGKKEDAFTVYYCYCEIFKIFGSSYDRLGKLVEFLSDHEYHSGELLKKHRDHYSHSVYVFALGLAIYANNAPFRNTVKSFFKKDKFTDTDFLRCWGLIGLFHDIGYPFQLAHEAVLNYVDDALGKEMKTPHVAYVDMKELLSLTDEWKSFSNKKTLTELYAEAVTNRLTYFTYDQVYKLLKDRPKGIKFMDHAYFSSVVIAHRLMEENIPLTTPLLDSLTAILMHNSLIRYGLDEITGVKHPTKVEVHPLAYLLMLCDELQNWDRKAFGLVSKKNPIAWDFRMNVSDESIDLLFIFDNDSCKRNANGTYTNKNANEIVSGDYLNKAIGKAVVPHVKINASLKIEHKHKEIKTFVSSDKLINLADFALAIHASYIKLCKDNGETPNVPEDFNDLPLEYKISNIEQAKSYAEKLELINCFYSDNELDYPIVEKFSDEEDGNGNKNDLSFLAREEHLRWVREKLNAGWTYGTDYKTSAERNQKRIHKDIVPFDVLGEFDQKKDYQMIENMVPLLYEQGHGVRIYTYRKGWKPVLNVAGCGHRDISMDYPGLKDKIKEILKSYQKDYRVIVRTNFAYGADTLIAECAVELGITIKAAIPMPYEKYVESIKKDAEVCGYRFNAEDERRWRDLIAQCVSLKVIDDPEYIYLGAALYNIKKCQKMIAVWDGFEKVLQDEKGAYMNQGGTYHNLLIAKKQRGLRDEDISIIDVIR